MTFMRRAPVLLILPFLFFGAGALTAAVATLATTLIAPKLDTLVEAAMLGQEDAIFRLVSAGDDPGLPTVLQRPMFRWRAGDTTTPLLVAVAFGDLRLVGYMLKNTKRMADPPNDQALCVAARFGHSDVTRLLMEVGAPAVPINGCGEQRWPEDIAYHRRAKSMGDLLRDYRLSKEG